MASIRAPLRGSSFTSPPPSPGTNPESSVEYSPQPIKKKRDLLKNYYGTQEEPQSWPTRADPIDLDSEAYLVQLATNKMIKELGLKELIRKDNDLVNDIKNLDGNMKTLVYENYSKFISATDTIRKMKSSADEMGTHIAQLELNVAAISASADTLHAGFQTQRSKIHQLSGVANLIKKLHFVFELPAKLQLCVKKRQYTQAVILYAKTSVLLNHYATSPVFKQIEQECSLIMADVSKRAFEKMAAKKWAKPSEITETVAIILGVGSSSNIQLVRSFFEAMEAELVKLLDGWKLRLFSLKSGIQLSDTDMDSIMSTEKLNQMNRSFLGELASCIDSFDAFFINPRDSAKSTAIPFYSSANLESLKNTVTARSISDMERELAQDELKLFLVKVESSYFDLIHSVLKVPEDVTVMSPASYIVILETLRQDISQFQDVLKVTGISQKIAEMTVTVLDKIISGVFGRVKSEFFVKIKGIQIDTVDVFTAVRQLISWIKEALIATALPVLERFVSPSETATMTQSKKTDILNRIRTTLFQFWADLSKDMTTTNLRSDIVLEPIHVLILSRLALEWSRGAIESIFSMYSQRLFEDAFLDSGRPPRGGDMMSVDSDIMKKGRDIALNYKNIAQLLLRKFALMHISKITIQIRLTIEHINTDHSKGEASIVWDDAVTTIEEMERQLVKAFEDDNDKRRKTEIGKNIKTKLKGNSATGSGTMLPNSSSQNSFGRKLTVFQFSSGPRDAVLANIDKLFQERLEFLLPKLEISRVVVVDTVVKCLLKAWIEELRFSVLTPEAYTQVETDVQFWRNHFWSFMANDGHFQTLLSDVSSIAYSRCIAPESVDSLIE